MKIDHGSHTEADAAAHEWAHREEPEPLEWVPDDLPAGHAVATREDRAALVAELRAAQVRAGVAR